MSRNSYRSLLVEVLRNDVGGRGPTVILIFVSPRQTPNFTSLLAIHSFLFLENISFKKVYIILCITDVS